MGDMTSGAIKSSGMPLVDFHYPWRPREEAEEAVYFLWKHLPYRVGIQLRIGGKWGDLGIGSRAPRPCVMCDSPCSADVSRWSDTPWRYTVLHDIMSSALQAYGSPAGDRDL